MQKPTFITLIVISLSATMFSGCFGRKTVADEPAENADESAQASASSDASKDPKDLKIDNLTSTLSRAQSRIEELDAKVSALTDKLESTRLTVDNITGTGKPIKTEAVGSAAAQVAAIDKKHLEAEAAEETPSAKPWPKNEAAIGSFNKAIALFKAGKYADAVLAFNHFTETFPEHILAGSAQFYAGESYYLMGEFKLAINEYGKVVSSFSSSPRVASAMVRTAHCYEGLGNKGESARTMALARDLFENNPSLDWSNTSQPNAASAKAEPKRELDSAPMEPKLEAHTNTEDKEIDNID